MSNSPNSENKTEQQLIDEWIEQVHAGSCCSDLHSQQSTKSDQKTQ